MAERRPRVVIVPPGGAGLKAALRRIVNHETVITALEDGALHAAKLMLGDQEAEEFLPFGSCVGRFAAMCGDTGFPRLTGPQSFHLIQRAAADLGFDNPLTGAATSLGLAKNLARTLTELRYHGLRPDDLRNASQDIPDSITADRLVHLAELTEIYEEKCHTNGREFASKRAEFCLDQTDPHHFTYKHLAVILVGDRSPVYDRWIQWVASQGVKVDCLIAAWPNSESAFSNELTWANELGEVEDWTTELTKNEAWSSSLFDRNADPIPTNPVKTAHYTMGDSLSESEWIIRQIITLQRDGIEPSRIGIFVRGANEIIPIFLSAAERLGLQVTGTRSSPLHANGFVAATLELLRAMVSGDLRNLRYPLGNSYFKIPAEEFKGLVQTFVTLQATSEDPWADLITALAENPDYIWIANLIEWRQNAIASSKTLRIWAELLHTIWSKTPILDHSVTGPREAIRRDQQAWTVMQRTIRDAALSYHGEQELELKEFVSLAEELWREEQIIWEAEGGTIRLCTNPSQLTGFDHLFCLNMLEGTLPRRRRQDPVLDDIDRAAINAACPNHAPLPFSSEIAHRERGLFVTLCAAAQESITFSHADAGEERDNIATFYLEEIKTLLPNTLQHTYPRRELTPPADQCVTWPDRTLNDALNLPRKDFTPPEITLEEAQRVIRPDFSEPLAIQELAQASTCPFRASFNHRVSFKAPDRSLPIAIMRGLPAKANLIAQPSASSARDVLKGLAKNELDEHLHRLDDWEQILYRDAIERIIQGWIEREFLSRNLLDLDEYERKDNFTTRSELRGDPPIKLKYHFDAIYERGHYKIGFLYTGYIPRYLANAKDDLENSLQATLLLHTLDKNHKENVAVMVDSLEGDRALLTLEKKVPWLAKSLWQTGIYHTSLRTDNPDHQETNIHNRFGQEIKRAQATLIRATAKPVSGDHCSKCALGDLCRTHNEFGEIQSIFDEDGS
jgi:hypothetical protein